MIDRKALQQKRRRVEFAISNPEAGQVFLVGDFNAWDPKRHPMKNEGQGLWKKTVMLVPGTYEYKFWVDGSWVADPDAARCGNCYGTFNNRITVAPKQAEGPGDAGL